MLGWVGCTAAPPAPEVANQTALGEVTPSVSFVQLALIPREGVERASLRVGDARREVTLSPTTTGWDLAVDTDGDGTIERLALNADDDGWWADVTLPARDPQALPHVVGLGRTRDGQLRIAKPREVRRGTIELDGAVAVELVRGPGDSYRVGVDVDRDGRVLAGDALGWRRPGEALAIGGAWWAPALDPGPALRLAPADPAGPGFGLPAPPISVTDLDGQTLTERDPARRPVVLEFWATWCRPCLAQQPELAALAKTHGLAVIGLAADDEATVRRHLVAHPLDWPVAAVGKDDPATRAYGVGQDVPWGAGWPVYALIAEDGTLRSLGALDTLRAALAP